MPAPKRRRRTDIPESRQTARVDYELHLARVVNEACDRWLAKHEKNRESANSWRDFEYGAKRK
jgi:hypothetical protein